MKKLIAFILVAAMLCTMTACAGKTAGTDKVGRVEVSAEVLEALGMSAEEFAAMDPEKQEAIMAEMGAVVEQQQSESKTESKPANKTATPDDVMSGGKYKVVMGDYLNKITLYYENGKLVRIEEEFRKNDEEETEYATYEGDSLAEYGFNFIDWDGVPLQDILDGMKDYGEFGQYKIVPQD